MKSGYPWRLVRTFPLLATLLFCMFFASVTAHAQSSEASRTRWLTYIDPRYHFSFGYPGDWQIIPRDDDPSTVSGFVKIVPRSALRDPPSTLLETDAHEPIPQIVIGHYLAEISDDQLLEEWTEQYESLDYTIDRALNHRQPIRNLRIRGVPAVQQEGISPLTTYQFTNLAYKNIVWYVWTNLPSDHADAPVYNRIVRSFRFSVDAPANLRLVYGPDFVPMDVKAVQSANAFEHEILFEPRVGTHDVLTGPQAEINNLSNTWYSPVKNQANGNPWPVVCGSPKHTDTGSYSKYAADISVPNKTPVWNAKTGAVTFTGWRTNGYGNLVTIKANGGKEAYYAHLTSINKGIVVGNQFPGFDFVGFSGNTTGDTSTIPYHLHFHVRWGNASEDLRGMNGFNAYTSYPGQNNGVSVTCGTMGR